LTSGQSSQPIADLEALSTFGYQFVDVSQSRLTPYSQKGGDLPSFHVLADLLDNLYADSIAILLVDAVNPASNTVKSY
jgi:hypothetical protein